MADFEILTIDEIRRETADAVSLALRVPNALAERFRFKPGQHLPVRAVLDGEDVRRTYSICSGPGEPLLRIAIKRLPEGRFSTWANMALIPGMTLDVMPPQGRFVLPASEGAPRHLLGIAAGAGITPIFAMIAHALAHEPATRFTLIYGNRTMDDVIFRAPLEDLKDRHLGRFSLVHVLSREESETPLLSGRITPETLARITSCQLDMKDVAHAFVCGPGQMIKDLRTQLFAQGLTRERVHHELFAPPGGAPRAPATSSPSPSTAPAHEVIVVLDGVRHRLEARTGEPVLDAALRAGLRVPYSCKGGMCCTCRARIIEGEAQMLLNYSLEAWEIEKGFTLTCQAVPTSPRLVVDYDQM